MKSAAPLTTEVARVTRVSDRARTVGFDSARSERTREAHPESEVISMATAKTFRPEDLAATLGISGKIVRAYLRKTYTRPASAKGSTWVLSAKQASDTLAYFKKRNPEAYAKAQKKRAPKRTPKPAAKPTESA